MPVSGLLNFVWRGEPILRNITSQFRLAVVDGKFPRSKDLSEKLVGRIA